MELLEERRAGFKEEFSKRGRKKWARVAWEVILILIIDGIMTIVFGGGAAMFWHYLGFLALILIIEHQVMTRMAVEDLNKSIANIGPITIDEK